MKISEIIEAIEAAAPVSLQEEWDNCGLQVGDPADECRGVMVCVDPTLEVIKAAARQNCNLVVSHHPLIFKPLKRVVSDSAVGTALRLGVTVYSAHTSLDNAPCGVSHAMAARLGWTDVRVLDPLPDRPDCGTGVIAKLQNPLLPSQLIDKLKAAFRLDTLRCSSETSNEPIDRVALVGGAGGSFIAKAVAAGAKAMVTGDIRHHDFVDWSDRIFLADITHFDSEECAKKIIMQIISKKFPNFASLIEGPDTNPIAYV